MKDQGTYLYFAADDSIKGGKTMDVTVEVEFFDDGTGHLGLEYDGSDARAAFDGAYTGVPQTLKLKGDKTWKTVRFRLSQARLLNRQNGGADFRLVASPSVTIGRVTLERDTSK